MTVAELIQQLQKLPQDLTVVRGDTDWNWVRLRNGGEIVLIEEAEAGEAHGWSLSEAGGFYDPEISYMKKVRIS